MPRSIESHEPGMDTASSRRTPAPRRAHPVFDPEPYRVELVAIVRAIEDVAATELPISPTRFLEILRAHPRDGIALFSRSQILAGYRRFATQGCFRLDEQAFVDRVQRRRVRSQSGVTPVTVLTHPYPCPGRCIFCPNDVRMPKSYLSDEPGAQRAALNHFDPYLQVWNRLAALHEIGHPIEKVELIVLGGTWSYYPEPYQVGFVRRLFEALEDFGAASDRSPIAVEPEPEPEPTHPSERSSSGAVGAGEYNRVVSRSLRSRDGEWLLGERERADWDELHAAQARNEHARCRCVGLVIETRPDHVTPREVERIRRLGCTKVQLGFQSLSDDVLAANRRGHRVAHTRRAMAWLRRAGFKVHAHWMPNLHGATPSSDVADFDRVFADPDFRPDELKVYPCSLIAGTELMQRYERGEWRPYTHAELLAVVAHAIASTPRYCRLTRVIRDISSDDIVAGNQHTNFRQLAERALSERGIAPVEIRAREVREQRVEPDSLRLRCTEYATSVGLEVFVEQVTEDDRLVGFARLSLPREPSFILELGTSALLRELHVYGAALELGRRDRDGAQHRGLGRRLLEAACERARQSGFASIAVISAVGTRAYYRRLGFRDGTLYQHRAL